MAWALYPFGHILNPLEKTLPIYSSSLDKKGVEIYPFSWGTAGSPTPGFNPVFRLGKEVG
jgi:hypothetical protein